MFELYILNDKNRVCYRKSPFDTGIQVWLVDVEEAPITQISGASYPNDQFSRPNFLPICHGGNFPGLDGAEFMAQGSRIIQTDSGNATVGSGKRHGDGDNNDVGYEIHLLPLNNKEIHTEVPFCAAVFLLQQKSWRGKR